jgi:cytochrome bd-type quinol oxidase subunit 2
MTTARTPKSVLISACAVPVLVVGQFAMLAILPIALVVSGTLRNEALRALRPWAALLAAVYAIPLALWAIGPDRAPSLSKDMHPVFVPLISVAAIAMVVVLANLRRRSPAVVKA